MTSSNPFWSYFTPQPGDMAHNLAGRLQDRLAHGDHMRVPSQEDVQSYSEPTPASEWSQVTFTYDTSKGANVTNLKDTNWNEKRSRPHSNNWPLTDKYYSLSAGGHELRCSTGTLWKTILLPSATIVLPMAFLVAGLLALIFGYRVKSDNSLFDQVSNSDALSNHAVVLVNYSATRIVFVASWASTLAPLLAGFIMNLASFQAALVMYHASSGTDQHDLPTPYQYSLLVGLCLASIGRLTRYFSYSGEDGVVIPPVLKRAARTLALTLVLACVVFGADTALHYTTSTINFDQVSIESTMHAYGRGLSSECLSLNRSDNYGLPCSRNGEAALTDYDDYVTGQNQIFFLQHGTSNVSEIRLVQAQDPDNAYNENEKVALLIPPSTTLSPFRDFRAETTGVITTCAPISSECAWKVWGPFDLYSQFNCSDSFWGVLGKSANLSDTGTEVTDVDVPTLGFKPSAALQYGFFMDKDLSQSYDSAGTLGPFMPDSELINPVFLGVAARFTWASQRPGVNMSSDPGVFQGPTSNIDVVFRCQYTTYAADYSFVNSTAQINSLTPSPNGTIAEIFHGYNLAKSFNAFDNNLQDFILQGALQSDPVAMADSFANSYSTRIMSVIGPFLSSRTNRQEQTRTPLLVAKVPKAPLAILAACCLGYVIFGVTAAILAHRSLSDVDVRDLAFRFSLPALGLHAFRDPNTDNAAVKVDGAGHRVFNESKVRSETMRVAVEGGPKSGFFLKTLV
ncbi:uncharacterized protein Z518_03732 [Rhinocladiella mackenziei CBS 650.93]|uniref:Rhinocladiella mackenziei CBS 650.93 unplaced genomic scaffold supercont1.3, whole genome shotgun sequence n=1 Tax=Rhinocladiella mackenziei CBS 650.93 TaxID=1442369 RepID=A0A0D2J9H1_9EURO|nr:uncharacterized protein Z518_03732 [Rhinocladiella mackenziei CBS 650.93]KIX05760.1 hypothetical protein Z518_03732 [Rhinocladiella mackenziei CBS 650.93]